MSGLRIALVEPYLGGSHEAWARGYQAHSQHDVEIISHDARFWKWRMQGGYLTLAESFGRAAATGTFDVVLASSMLHLPAFLGAARYDVGGAAVGVYFHESQLTYPISPRDLPDETYPLINWGSAAVADRVFFNSSFHRDTFFAAARSLLRRFPDQRHGRLLEAVRNKSEVLAVGVDLRRLDGAAPAPIEPPVILWNQRWEFDKGPEEFAAVVTGLAATGREFRVAVTGERFVGQPDGFATLPARLGERLGHFGYAPEEEYRRLLAAADIVVSTSLQEFFGIAVTEAMYAGAFPVLPERLVYPERIPRQFHERCLYPPGGLASALLWALDHPEDRRRVAAALREEMVRYDWGVVAPLYDGAFAAMTRAQETA